MLKHDLFSEFFLNIPYSIYSRMTIYINLMFHCVTAILFRWGVFNPRNNDTLPKSSPRHFTMKYIWVFFKNWGKKKPYCTLILI